MANVPQDLKYTKDHEWVRRDGGRAVIGVTDFAQRQLGDVVFVELPSVDERFDVGEPFGSVESVKAVSEIYMPVSGTVLETNETLNDSPELINEDPYGDAWLVRIDATNASEFDGLLSADEYDAYLKEAEE